VKCSGLYSVCGRELAGRLDYDGAVKGAAEPRKG
jgi:hypothetical protein